MSNKIIKNAGYNHIAFRAKNYEDTMKFYREGLGCELYREWVGDDGRCSLIDLGNKTYIEVYEGAKGELPEGYDKMAGSYFHFAIETSDTDSAFAAAVKAGAKVKDEPFDTTIMSNPPLPIRIAFVYGPSNELIEFFQVR